MRDSVLNDRYRTLFVIGRGAMSEVHQAVDLQTGDAVAVKCVSASDTDHAQRMLREIDALGCLNHPGLVRLLDAGSTDAEVYLVMELIRGPSLGQVLRDGSLPSERVARIGTAVAAALDYVHANGIVHRDVTPANILIGPGGDIRLADFGIARITGAQTLTLAGTMIGTPAYMAPEQIRDHEVGAPADVFALGAVMLEALRGSAAFAGTPQEILGRRLAGPLVVPSELPARWRRLLCAMLDPDPSRRPGAGDVAARCAALAEPSSPDGVPVPAGTEILTRPGPKPRSDKRASRRFVGALGLALIAAVALVAALLGNAITSSTHQPTKRAAAAVRGSSRVPSTARYAISTSHAPASAGPSPADAALTRLVGDLESVATTGDIPLTDARLVADGADQATASALAGNDQTAATDLAGAENLVQDAARSGSMTGSTEATVMSDLAVLAAALGVPFAQDAPAPPDHGHHGAHGDGHGANARAYDGNPGNDNSGGGG